MGTRRFGWIDIVRLGLVQTALGAMLILTTSTLNRVMVVELALPAIVPGLLVALHHAVQMLRPRWGYGSDRGGRRSPWIVGGMAVLGSGVTLAAMATALIATSPVAGLSLAVVAFALIGIGVGAAGTNVLILLAERVDDRRRAPAATIVWVMMIAGFIVTAGIAGHLLDPYSPERLVLVAAGVSAAAFLVSVAAIAGVERRTASVSPAPQPAAPGFRKALAAVWDDPAARRFTVFIFVSMVAYSAQDLLLEPYAGIVFAMTPGETTQLGSVQNGGVLAGMVLTGFLGHRLGGGARVLRTLMVTGCLASALSLMLVAGAGDLAAHVGIAPLVALLGLSNGAFAVAAIGSMMGLAGSGPAGSRGTRMGLWGAAQAIAFGVVAVAGTGSVDLAGAATGDVQLAYRIVFIAAGALFVVSAGLVLGLGARPAGAVLSPTDARAGGR